MKTFKELNKAHLNFIEQQKMFFVATCPLAPTGHVNLSPKGYSTFRVLNSNSVSYLDLGGSGIETHSHLNENGRICIMFCAFEGSPLILRLYGIGKSIAWGSNEYDEIRKKIPPISSRERAVVTVNLDRVQESCGWGVPEFEFIQERNTLLKANSKRTQEDFMRRRRETNAVSIDGLPGLQ